MISDITSRVYYKATAGKYKGQFVPLDFKIKSLVIYIKVKGFDTSITYRFPKDELVREISRLMKKYSIKRLSPQFKDVIKDRIREIATTQFKEDWSRQKKHREWERAVIVGKKPPTKKDEREKTRFYHKDLRGDVKVNWKYYEDDVREEWTLDFETSYRNHPTFILLPLGINEFYNPSKFKELIINGKIAYNQAKAVGEKRKEILAMSKDSARYFKIDFYSKLFGNKAKNIEALKDYWLILPTYKDRKKVSSGITPVGMITYAIRDLVENKMGFTISGSFQRRVVKQTYIEWYGVHINIVGIKAKDEKFQGWYNKQLELIKEKIKKHKLKKKLEEQEAKKRALKMLKEAPAKEEVKYEKKQKGWKYSEERGFEPEKPIDYGRKKRGGQPKRKKR